MLPGLCRQKTARGSRLRRSRSSERWRRLRLGGSRSSSRLLQSSRMFFPSETCSEKVAAGYYESEILCSLFTFPGRYVGGQAVMRIVCVLVVEGGRGLSRVADAGVRDPARTGVTAATRASGWVRDAPYYETGRISSMGSVSLQWGRDARTAW
jgi:hypothetical protein